MWILLCLSIFVGSVAAQKSPQERGYVIAKKVSNRNKGKDSTSAAKMVLISKSGKKRIRDMKIYEVRPSKKVTKTLIRFTGPVNIEGTGLLTIDENQDDADQWVYLPELKKSRRITSSGKGGRFVGSDFYYEDLQTRDVDKDHHVFVKREKYEGIRVDVIQSRPKKRKSSSYSKKMSWIHPELHIPLKIDFFRRNNKIKTLYARRIDQIQGIWTVLESEMVSYRDGHKTQIVKSSVKYNSRLSSKRFNQRVLTDPSQDKLMK